MEHFRRWGLEVQARSYLHPFKGSKTELHFCARPLSTYQDPSTCDNTDMSDLILPNGRFVICTCGDQAQVPRLLYFKWWIWYNRCSISDQFCSLCFWGIIQMPLSVTKHWSKIQKCNLWISDSFCICLYGWCESWCLTEKPYSKLRQFHARFVRTMSHLTLTQSRMYQMWPGAGPLSTEGSSPGKTGSSPVNPR